MTVLRRQRLVHLRPDAWPLLQRAAHNAAAHSGMAHWAHNDLPLVVARQAGNAAAQHMSLGLPLPDRWGRQRLSVQVSPAHIDRFAEFPAARDVTPLLVSGVGTELCRLCDAFDAIGVSAQAYGSYGWQRVTGLAYVRASSDLDLLVQVADAEQADAAATLLFAVAIDAPALDGELMFPNGIAVAWREWRRWRRGETAQILLKHHDSVSLAADTQWLDAPVDAPVDATTDHLPVAA